MGAGGQSQRANPAEEEEKERDFMLFLLNRRGREGMKGKFGQDSQDLRDWGKGRGIDMRDMKKMSSEAAGTRAFPSSC
jgi:hypothetical protein